mmetsp:Transcript_3576/g.6349  ORF Transcript_3576/g.6349 Transcript_3576/m.6349 type:complete len:102 (-) Transcript_3576:154-459(-)
MVKPSATNAKTHSDCKMHTTIAAVSKKQRITGAKQHIKRPTAIQVKIPPIKEVEYPNVITLFTPEHLIFLSPPHSLSSPASTNSTPCVILWVRARLLLVWE